MTTWQNPVGPDFLHGPPTLSDIVATVRRAFNHFQQNNPVLMDDRGRIREGAQKALDWAEKIARIADRISAGHAYYKHAVEQDEFPEIKSRQEFRDLIAKVLKNPTEWKQLERGRSAYWDKETGTVVVRDPGHPDGGTAFRPKKGKSFYDKDLN